MDQQIPIREFEDNFGFLQMIHETMRTGHNVQVMLK
jgi:hypothetical protein